MQRICILAAIVAVCAKSFRTEVPQDYASGVGLGLSEPRHYLILCEVRCGTSRCKIMYSFASRTSPWLEISL